MRFFILCRTAAKRQKEVLMKNFKKLTAILIGLCLAASPLNLCAAYESVDIRFDGADTEIGALLIGTTTYVPFDSANSTFSRNSAEITGSPSSMTAVSPFATVKASVDDCYIEAQGRYFGGSGCITISGMLYVPVRSLAKAYGADVKWDDATRSVDVYPSDTPILHGDDYYRSDEVYWLSRIISAEAKGEPLNGKIMVGNVILNRVASSQFPNTIYGVIFDDEFGVQFTPTLNGTIHQTPTPESTIAAKLCLDGYSLSKNAMYFLNPKWATNFWVPNNRPYLTTIGSHDFYA